VSSLATAGSRSMPALSYEGRGTVKLTHKPIPQPGIGEVLVQVAFCGVCGSDVSEFEKGPLQAHVSEDPHRVTAHHGPVVLGHEFSGWVLARGAGVSVALGTLVSCSGGVPCGVCAYCRAGRGNLCADYYILGMHRDGGLAEYCVAPESTCADAGAHGLSPAVAALAQPAGIAVHALRRSGVAAGDRLAVVGVGAVGVFLLYAAIERGATVVAIDPDPSRLALARRLGAQAAETQVQRVHGAFDVVFEVSGTQPGLASSLMLAGRGGELMLVGIQPAASMLSAREIVMSELSIDGSVSLVPAVDLPEALRVLRTRVEGWHDIAPMVFPLRDVTEQGLRTGSAPDRIKTLFSPVLDAPMPLAKAERLVGRIAASSAAMSDPQPDRGGHR
jgi:(R,R)-butanediol dehydrogenase/meso-butanediol dehydrogenase/diacetyl reductase